jgi:hypothetical protein
MIAAVSDALLLLLKISYPEALGNDRSIAR